MFYRIISCSFNFAIINNFKSYKDNRGVFSEVYLTKLDHPEFKIEYVQENESISNFGVFRGMHMQKGNNSQSKLIRVVKGKIIDVVCDLRKSSPSFIKNIFWFRSVNCFIYFFFSNWIFI